MSLNKLTKSFFTSKQKLYCCECQDHILKYIVIYGNYPFIDIEEYSLLLEWRYNVNYKFEITKSGNLSPDDNVVIDKTSSISSIKDLQRICKYLNTLGYQISETRLITECENRCSEAMHCFRHIMDLIWFGDSKTFLLESEYVKLNDYSIGYNYSKNNSYITDRNVIKHKTYDFDYILNIDIKKYNVLKNKIKQTLLLG